MIISAAELKKYVDCSLDDAVVQFKLDAIEAAIRSYTNNNFQNRIVRTVANVENGVIYGDFKNFKIDDTIQISDGVNSGLYVIASKTDESITINEPLCDVDKMLVTKVDYPKDVVIGAINMFDWDMRNRDKIGIQSETISRHSVTYFNLDASNTQLNYPVSLLGFLKPYMKARF